MRVADSLSRASRNPAEREEATYIGASARAHLSLARLDTARRSRSSWRFRIRCASSVSPRPLDDGAIARGARQSRCGVRNLSEWPTEALVAREALMTLDRAKVAERLGRREEARRIQCVHRGVAARGHCCATLCPASARRADATRRRDERVPSPVSAVSQLSVGRARRARSRCPRRRRPREEELRCPAHTRAADRRSAEASRT